MNLRFASICIVAIAGLTFIGCGNESNGGTDPVVDGGGNTNDGGGNADGGGGDAGANDGGSAATTCTECAMAECSDQHTACQGSTPCTCTLECIDNGGNEGTCKRDCDARQDQAWSDLIDCLDTSTCADNC